MHKFLEPKDFLEVISVTKTKPMAQMGYHQYLHDAISCCH